jgi:hypothetical protein
MSMTSDIIQTQGGNGERYQTREDRRLRWALAATVISQIHEEEDQDYLGRTSGSQATKEGRASSDAVDYLKNATHLLEQAIEALESL